MRGVPRTKWQRRCGRPLGDAGTREVPQGCGRERRGGARGQIGKEKYNNTLDRTDLSVIDYLQHAKEEAMDLALYLEKTIQMLKGKK